jgi:putative ABC transport system permease protein
MIDLGGLMGTLDFALRNVLRQRTRTLLTLAALALGVASLVLTGGYVEDILIQLREATIHSRLGHLQVYKTGMYSSDGQRPFDYLMNDASAVERAIAEVPGVAARGRRLSFFGLLNNGRGDMPIIGEGVEPEAESRIGTAVTMLSGRRLMPEDRFAVVVGEGLAHAMKLELGDSVNLVLSTRDGAMNTLEFSVVGKFRSLSKEYDARAVQIPLAAAAELVDTPGVSAVVVLLDETEATERARAALAAKLPAAQFEIKTWEQLADFYNSTTALYQRQFAVLQLIILLMVLLSVANTVNMTLHERTSEFGVMRALGRRSADIFGLAVIETAVLGVVGAALGVIVGIAMAVLVSAIGISMPPPPNFEAGFTMAIRVVPSVVVVAFLLGVAGAVVASLMPAWKIARIPVVEALREAI